MFSIYSIIAARLLCGILQTLTAFEQGYEHPLSSFLLCTLWNYSLCLFRYDNPRHRQVKRKQEKVGKTIDNSRSRKRKRKEKNAVRQAELSGITISSSCAITLPDPKIVVILLLLLLPLPSISEDIT
ncbi:hypothetical protein BGZ63DRAFT_46566 [Mariannaea sp. PMI_226]|nr:hypothetical protein BGZ63DRAFT_46566 [Mariannaea sp. PMI_226]